MLCRKGNIFFCGNFTIESSFKFQTVYTEVILLLLDSLLTKENLSYHCGVAGYQGCACVYSQCTWLLIPWIRSSPLCLHRRANKLV